MCTPCLHCFNIQTSPKMFHRIAWAQCVSRCWKSIPRIIHFTYVTAFTPQLSHTSVSFPLLCLWRSYGTPLISFQPYAHHSEMQGLKCSYSTGRLRNVAIYVLGRELLMTFSREWSHTSKYVRITNPCITVMGRGKNVKADDFNGCAFRCPHFKSAVWRYVRSNLVPCVHSK